MSARFKDQTTMWFRQGESVEVLLETPEADPVEPRGSRLRRAMLVLGWLSLAVACSVYVAAKGVPGRHQPLPPLQIQPR